MKPIKFPEANKDLVKPAGWTDEQCGTLPVYTDGLMCVSCWRPTLRERLSMLFYGKVWLWVHSGYTQPPVAIEGTRQIFGVHNVQE